MLAAIIDKETTGLNPLVDRVIQYAIVIYDVFKKKTIDYRSWLVYQDGFEVAQEKTHGWDLATLKSHGKDPATVLCDIQGFVRSYRPRFVLAHNGINFDRNFLREEVARAAKEEFLREYLSNFDLVTLPWIDTLHHKDYPGCPGKALLTLAAHHGFLNPFPHNALFDCVTLAKIIEQYDILEFVSKAAEASYIVAAGGLPPYDWKTAPALNSKLKELGFKFENHKGHHFEKTWFQVVPASKFHGLMQSSQGICSPNIIKEILAPDEVLQLYKELT